jgi:hypothetical protein
LKRIADEYVRHGVAVIFVVVDALAGNRYASMTERPTHVDWVFFIKGLNDEKCSDAEKFVLVMDNLNTHEIVSLYEAF